MTEYMPSATDVLTEPTFCPLRDALTFDGANSRIDLSEDITQNGSFGSATGWTLTGGWAIIGGNAAYSVGSGGFGLLTQSGLGVIRAGELYRVSYEVTTYAGSSDFFVTVGGNTAGGHAATGTYTDYVYCESAIDSFSVVPPTGGGAMLTIPWIKIERVDRFFANRRMTISAWVRPHDIVTTQGIVTNGVSASGAQGLTVDSGVFLFRTYVAGVDTYAAATASPNQWQHVVATRDYDGTTTTLKIYVDGTLIDTTTATGSPNVSGHRTPMIGDRDTDPFDGEMMSNVTLIYGAASAAWVAAEYARGLAAIDSGPYAEQMLAAPVNSPRTLTVRGFAVGGRDPGVPMLRACDADGNWDVWGDVGSTESSDELLSISCPNGVSGVRMFSKFNSSDGAAFDDVQFSNGSVLSAQVPARLRSKFLKMIARGKPLHSWAAIVIEWT